MSNPIHWLAPAALVIVSPCLGVQYLAVEDAQKACFPEGTKFSPANVNLTDDQIKAIEEKSDIEVLSRKQQVWKVAKGSEFIGWFIVDDVIGKHEFITYALAIKLDGSVKSIEIMDYRESYGYQIRGADWRRQFVGKKNNSKLRLNDDIRNISGATLSCRHITEGVKRLLAFYEVALKNS